jgi:hypothetical protein
MRGNCRALLLSASAVMTISGVLSLTAQGLASTTAGGGTPAKGHLWRAAHPRPAGELDCNGHSPVQTPVKRGLTCTDPRGSDHGRFEDNGHYVGHDEPSVRFLSDRPGSGNSFTMNERLPVDPLARPTAGHPGQDVTHWFELSIAPWISMTVCDPHSTPLLPCTPNSDANAPRGLYPGAGAAFVELQFYPPGFAPFADSISCDNLHWCSALNIDSLECTTSGRCNNDCIEPVNFAFVQRDGVPPGPPSPQLSSDATFTPNSRTLMMNPGDKITVRLFDAKIPGGHALEAQEIDHTTGQSGFMIASAANGFKNTNPVTCAGHPFSFQPEYSTAKAANIIPWGIGPYMINNEFEIGHFEPCTGVSGIAHTLLNGVPDLYYTTCRGPYERPSDSADIFEPDDSPCYRAGDTHGGQAPPNVVTGCDVFFNAVGDLDFDGTSYRSDWPNSSTAERYPTPFLQQQPTSRGHAYRQFQFMTDVSASELNTNCDLISGAGCVLPPQGPGSFYPFFTLARVNGSCVWEFGNMSNGAAFGGDAQYGIVRPGSLGAFVGPVRRNRRC